MTRGREREKSEEDFAGREVQACALGMVVEGLTGFSARSKQARIARMKSAVDVQTNGTASAWLE